MGTLWLDAAVSVTIVVKSYSDQPLEGADVRAFAVSSDWSN